MLIAARLPRALVSALLLSVVQPVCNAQDVEPLKFFRNYVGLHEDQITAIRSGKAVAKMVESRTPDEVFVFGSVYVRSPPEEYLKLASDIAQLCKLPNYLAIQKFSDPPQLSDLEGFTLEPEDNELGGIRDSEQPGGSRNPIYTQKLRKIDRNFFQYIYDITDDEMSHRDFLNAYLVSMGAEPVDLEPYRTLQGSTATGSSGKVRLTNLMQLTIDSSWWTRYRSGTNNPDVNPTMFEQAVPDLHKGQFTAIPRTDNDLAQERLPTPRDSCQRPVYVYHRCVRSFSSSARILHAVSLRPQLEHLSFPAGRLQDGRGVCSP